MLESTNLKARQVRWTISLGTGDPGAERLARWQVAALKVMQNNPKLFNAWIRSVLDAEASRLLNKPPEVQ